MHPQAIIALQQGPLKHQYPFDPHQQLLKLAKTIDLVCTFDEFIRHPLSPAQEDVAEPSALRQGCEMLGM